MTEEILIAEDTGTSINPNDVNYLNYKGYNGNVNLKRIGVQIDWTPDLVAEYIRCSQDPIYFCETYMKIIHADDGLVPFKMYDYQKEMMLSMKDNRNTIITTARQSGKSTTTCGFILWYIIFQEKKTVALLANKGDIANEILGKIQLAYQHLPKWLQQGVVEWNKGSLVLENTSRVVASATSGDSIRGFTINLLFIDEAAFIDNWDEFFTSTLPTITSGKTTKIVLVSTPNGLNHFHALWNYAKQGKNAYNPIEVQWQQVPGRDENWKAKTLSDLSFDYDKFNQEYSCEFLGSSGTLIAGWKLKELSAAVALSSKEGALQYEEPKPGRIYCTIADVSHGKGLDYSTFSIIDVTEMPYKQVFVFRDNSTPPFEFAEIINRVSRVYNHAAVLVETNDIGGTVVDALHNDLEYEHILYTVHSGRAGKVISNSMVGGTGERGIRTTKTVKSIGCSLLKLLIEQNQLVINDKNTIDEIKTFSKKGQSYEAESGKHDDLVMPLVLFAWMTDQSYFKELTDINTLSRLRDRSAEEIEDTLLPFGFINSYFEDEMNDTLELGSPVDYDINWLLG